MTRESETDLSAHDGALPPRPPAPLAERFLSTLVWSASSIRLQSGLLAALGLFRRGSPPPPSAAERILVLKLDGIGDHVLLTPFLAELRRAKPGAWIALVTTPQNRDLALAGAPVDRILCIPKWRGRLRQWLDFVRFAYRELRPVRPTLAIVPRWDVDNYHAFPLLVLSGAPRRVSYSVAVNSEKKRLDPRGDRFLTEAILDPTPRHEVENHLRLLAAIGVDASPVPTRLAPRADPESTLRRVLPSLGDRALVAVCPFSAEPVKDWPLPRFLAVVRAFASRPDLRFALLAAPSHSWVNELDEVRTLPNLVSLAGALSLDETAALLSRCRLALTVDTGLMHIAAAMGCPAVVVHGLAPDHEPASHYSSRRFGPWMADHTLVAPAVHARGPRRIDAVTVPQVVSALEARLAPAPATVP